MAVHGHAVFAQRRFQGGIMGDRRRLVAAVPVHRAGAGGGDQCAQCLQGRRSCDVQAAAVFRQLAVQRIEAMVQPPAAGRAGRPRGFLVRRMHVHRQHARVRGAGGMQGGIVGQAQVAPEQHQSGGHRGPRPSGRYLE